MRPNPKPSRLYGREDDEKGYQFYNIDSEEIIPIKSQHKVQKPKANQKQAPNEEPNEEPDVGN